MLNFINCHEPKEKKTGPKSMQEGPSVCVCVVEGLGHWWGFKPGISALRSITLCIGLYDAHHLRRYLFEMDYPPRSMYTSLVVYRLLLRFRRYQILSLDDMCIHTLRILFVRNILVKRFERLLTVTMSIDVWVSTNHRRQEQAESLSDHEGAGVLHGWPPIPTAIIDYRRCGDGSN